MAVAAYVLADSLEARSHEARMVATHGRHSLTSCPPNTRAMCDYAVRLVAKQ